MNRRELIRHLESNGCELFREGGKHSLYIDPANNQTSAVPRHREVNDFLAQDLPSPRNSGALTVYRAIETKTPRA